MLQYSEEIIVKFDRKIKNLLWEKIWQVNHKPGSVTVLKTVW